MTFRGLVLVAAVVSGTLTPAPAASADDGCGGPIRPASIITVASCDSPDRIVAKAAAVVPRPGQLAWQQRPVTAFTHFGMNTFTDREWGSGAEKESVFAPPVVDTAQWMRSLKAAGVTQVMLTAKHHDGFVLYPTRYTNHSVVASPWWLTPGCTDPARDTAQANRERDPSAYWQTRNSACANPRGDILRDYVESARAAGLKVGVYLSPADGAELPKAFFADEVERIEAKVAAGQPLSIEEQATYEDRASAPQGQGRYGTGSAVTRRTIPTLVPHDDRAGALAAGKLPRFTVTEDDYNAYYLNQIYELFTQYGPIDELWLDGANPWRDHGISETYDFTTWFRMIHALSPDTVTFAGPAGVRWVGNEAGQARETEWSALPTTGDPNTAHNEELFLGGATAAGPRVAAGPGRPGGALPAVGARRIRRLDPAGLVLPPGRTAEDPPRSSWTSTGGPSGGTRRCCSTCHPGRTAGSRPPTPPRSPASARRSPGRRPATSPRALPAPSRTPRSPRRNHWTARSTSGCPGRSRSTRSGSARTSRAASTWKARLCRPRSAAPGRPSPR